MLLLEFKLYPCNTSKQYSLIIFSRHELGNFFNLNHKTVIGKKSYHRVKNLDSKLNNWISKFSRYIGFVKIKHHKYKFC